MLLAAILPEALPSLRLYARVVQLFTQFFYLDCLFRHLDETETDKVWVKPFFYSNVCNFRLLSIAINCGSSGAERKATFTRRSSSSLAIKKKTKQNKKHTHNLPPTGIKFVVSKLYSPCF